jgi:hypothetical protein
MVKSTIYKICCKDSAITDCYVGRTIDVTTRQQQHKTNCYNEKIKAYNYKIYKTIREQGGFVNWDFMEIETVEHDSKDTTPAREREFFWFNELKATLNNNTPNQSHTDSCKKWFANNKEHSKLYDKQYREKNKDKIKIKNKKYYEDHKEKLIQYCKTWVDANREKNRVYQRERCRKIAEQKRLQKLETSVIESEAL